MPQIIQMVDVFNPNNYTNIYKWKTIFFITTNYALNLKVNEMTKTNE